ncbi:MAG: excinuclease ABC subunit C [Phycisphaerae bacterium]|nr:excinuclease ABC subunit C [Phycisphaerae bacterium]
MVERGDHSAPGKGTPEEPSRREVLARKARGLPEGAGVYLFKDETGQVIYVGKASTLRSRVGSYFVASADLGPRKQPMIELIHDVEFIEADGEWEALLVEARLIKDIRPRFNVMLKDGKSYPYLAITTRETFPGLYITRNPQDPAFKRARIFGPFSSSGALREAVQVMQRIFRFRTCHLDIVEQAPENRFFRPCLLHAIELCSAPCADRIDSKAYGEDIDRLLRFLGSQRTQVLKELREAMTAASQSQDYERAASLRDQVQAIERLDERGQGGADEWQPEVTVFATDPTAGLKSLQRTLGEEHPIRCMEAIDIAHLGGDETVGSKVCFIDGRPFKDGYRRYQIKSVKNDDYAAIQEVVRRRYREAGQGHELYPDVILIDGGLGQLNAAMEAFTDMSEQPPLVISLAKKEELIWVQDHLEPIRLGRANPGLKLCQAIRDEAHRFAQHYHHILRRKKLLGD